MKWFALLLCLSAMPAFAEGEAFSELSQAVKKKTVEKMAQPKVTAKTAIKGAQTGGSCKLASDCILGCKNGDSEITCISAKEGSAGCVSSSNKPANADKCTCLTSMFACGFAF